MNPQPWQEVDKIFQGALQRDPAERDAYVRHACHGDTELQREVSSPRLAGDMFDIIVPASALQNLPDYKLYVRTLLHGRPQEPYLVDGFPPFPKDGKEAPADLVIRTSRARFGQDRQVVEKGLNRFLAA